MLKYAVVHFYKDEHGFLECEIWSDGFLDIQDAEEQRFLYLKEPGYPLNPQNFQVIQYDDYK